jgi:hypothetical protein
MAITWTKKFDSSDDLSILTGAQLGTIQDDIDAGTTDAVVSPITMVFSSASTDATVYCASPVTGSVASVYVANYSSARTGVYTVRNGSAGVVIATGTATSGVAGSISTLTLGTVAVTAGVSIGITRATMGSDGQSSVTILFNKAI